MYALAIVVAMIGAQVLQASGSVDLLRSIYVAPRFLWLAHGVGGFLFGVGMTLASGCGARNLVRLGGGNLKSLLVLGVMAVTAYATLRGVLAPVRVHGLEGFVRHVRVDAGHPVHHWRAGIWPRDCRSDRSASARLVLRESHVSRVCRNSLSVAWPWGS